MVTVAEHESDVRRANTFLLGIAAAFFVLEWLPTLLGQYGYFIDELYYLACARHLALGYVDHPPLSVVLLALVRSLGGDALPVLRLVPAAAGAATVLVTGLIARRLGAGLFGQAIAALAVVSCPIYQIFFSLYSMNSLSLLLWATCFYILVEIQRQDRPRLWLVFGAVFGLGLENKHTIVLLGAGLAVGLLASPARRHLAHRWIWLGAAIAILILSPNLYWQMANGWPSLEFYRNADFYKNIPTPPLEVLRQQVLFMNPATLLVWGAGCVYFLGTKAGRRYRHLGWIYVTLLTLMLVGQKSRPDRIAPAYIALFAGGAVAIDSWIRHRPWRWLRIALPALLVLAGAGLAPLALPVLPPAQTAAYAARLGIVPQIEAGEGKKTRLPQWLADRLGWRQLAADVESVIATLGPDERRQCVIMTTAYGLAGALELLGHDLPPVYAVQNSYHEWGPPPDPMTVAVVVDLSRDVLEKFFADVQLARRSECEFCTPWREGLPIWIVRDPKVAIGDVWPEFKHYE